MAGKIDSFKKAKAPKPTNASLLFPEIQRELTANPEFAGSLMGLFVIEVLERGNPNYWYLSFYGRAKAPSVSREKPHFPTKGTKVPVCIIELEDRDILKFVTGGLHGLKAFTENKIRIAGDITLAVQLEEVFRTTGGVEKAKEFLKNSGSSLLASKL